MELRQLVYFDAVVQHGGFTRAAEALHVAQPAISAQIRRLENELGTELLHRTTRQVRLTDAGETFLTRAQSALRELDAARTEVTDRAHLLTGRLAIGATPLLGGLDLTGALAGFHRAHPGVTLALRTGLIAALLDELADGTVELVVGPVDDDLPNAFLARPLVAQRLVLVTPPGHPLGHRRQLGLADLADDPFVCLERGSGLDAILRTAARTAGFTPRIEFETHGPQSVRELVAAGLGVALLAETVAQQDGPRIGVHRLHPAVPHPPIGVIRRRNSSRLPAARAFAKALSGAPSTR